MNQVFISGLPYETNEEHIYKLFEECGDIVQVKLPKYQDSGKLIGYGHITFGDQDAVPKAIAKSGTKIGSRYIEVKEARGVGSNTKSEDPPEDCLTIFVKSLPYELTADQIGDAFRPCGKIENVRMVYNHASGKFKGFAYIDFEQHISVKKALQMNGKRVHGRQVAVDFDVGKPKGGFHYAKEQLQTQQRYNNQISEIQNKKIKKDKVKDKVSKIKDFGETQRQISAKRNKEMI